MPSSKHLSIDSSPVLPKDRNRLLFELCQRFFLIPFPPSLIESFDFDASYTIRFDPPKSARVGLPRKILDYYFSTSSTENSAYFFSCHWRYWEAAYAELLISTLHKWAFQAQDELQAKGDSKFFQPAYWPPPGIIDYHFTNFILRINSCLDHLACWINGVHQLGCNIRHVYYYRGSFKDKLVQKDSTLHSLFEQSLSWVEPLQEYRNQIIHRRFGLLFPVETPKHPARREAFVVVPPSSFGLDLDRLLQQPMTEWQDINIFCSTNRRNLQLHLMKVFKHLAISLNEF